MPAKLIFYHYQHQHSNVRNEDNLDIPIEPKLLLFPIELKLVIVRVD